MKKDLKHLFTLTGIMAGFWGFVSGLLLGLFGFVDPATMNAETALGGIPSLFLICLCNAVIVLWYSKRSTSSANGLFGMVFLIIFGVMFFMTQIETVYFNDAIQMPWQVILSVVASGIVVGLAAAMYAKKVLYKENHGLNSKKDMIKKSSLIPRILGLSILYMMFYFVFGYYVAWQFPDLREYYSGTREIIPFLEHMKNQVETDSTLIVFQIIRGALWAKIGYFTLMTINTEKSIEKYFLVGCVLSIGLCTPLFAPNEYMPPAVRFGHFFELLLENFLFGVAVVYALQGGFEKKREKVIVK